MVDAQKPDKDITNVQPIRTTIHLEEEITIVRRVRKIEEYDLSPTCPLPNQR